MQIRNAPLALAVYLAVLGTFMVAPRPTRPSVLPLPQVDAGQLRSREEEERRLARDAAASPLDVEVRTVGEELRRLNVALLHDDTTQSSLATDLRRDVARLVEQGRALELRALRALQSELFSSALCAFWPPGEPRRGEPSTEFVELAGAFERTALDTFSDDEGRLLLRDDDLRLLFRVHWGRLTGLYRHPDFGPSLDELRRYHSLSLQYPEQGRLLDPASRAAVRLRSVRALAELDANYPADLAAGWLLAEMGRPEEARASLRRHLEQHPDGPFTLLAKNSLLAHLRLEAP